MPQRRHPIDAGINVAIVVALVLLAVAIALPWLFPAEGWGAEIGIPDNAARWRSTLVREVRYSWGLWQDEAPFFAQVHQESGWRVDARSRYASGLTQFTPATARGMQAASRLRELCGDAGGCPLDPAWALRAMVTYDKGIWDGFEKLFEPGQERLAAALVGYNGGEGWVLRERAKCAADAACLRGKWFGHVERYCLRGASACDESRHYPRAILLNIAPRYRAWLRGGLR